MYKHPLEQVEKFDPKEMPLLVDKSIQFETAAFLMATFGRNTNISLDAAIETANIFWLVDDLCDFIEDIKAKRKNSMLFFCVHNNELLTIAERAKIAFHNAEEFICLLEENLTLLKTNTSQQFYQYILNEVWEWCSNVRKLSK
ncbi:MAG: hypothetical protein IKJ01_03715 [Lachnospiraceae bacterium]|nr:hypothetical protein [Lachnospiraceae bacterium]